uniref:Glycosyl transferase family 2 n=1 Tax=Candidatus Kentrum sp. FM TaxID=2126340 RepID=A0A450TUF9_9GAMM|nr:MAG: Glycosyl transferase family 2 [Candidatus Kentron sp. FM]VFJ72503.1 MAG: Glycosyl transferase family 2 [Candidatus Kentron sp. FM]VFK19827.1 MAG: Glycosyl transferase family 2 [Candidatus Kentron sp. FM]
MKPIITAIIPTYRRPKLLHRAIRSVLDQTFRQVRVSVYDNNSNDGTRAMVESLIKTDPRVTYHCHARNIGSLNNFEYGLQQVRTPYYSFLSDDDMLLPGFYADALQSLESRPNCVMSVFQVIILATDGRLMGRNPGYFPAGEYRPPEGFSTMVKLGAPIWTGVLFRNEPPRHLEVAVGHLTDVEYLLRLAAGSDYCVVDRPGAIFTHDGKEKASYQHAKERLFARQKTLSNLYARIHGFGLPDRIADEAVRILNHYYGKKIYRTGLKCASRGEGGDLRKAIAILRDMDHEQHGALQTVLKLTAIIPPPFVRLLAAGHILSNPKPRLPLGRNRRYRDKYGPFLEYENANVKTPM